MDAKKIFWWSVIGTVLVVTLTGVTAYQAGASWAGFFEGIGNFFEGTQAGSRPTGTE